MAEGIETVRRIGDLLGQVRTVVRSNDPDARAQFFDNKAALFDEIAAQHPWQADEATAMAETARTQAAALRSAATGEGGAA